MDDTFLAKINSRVILLGEIHGTVEMPEFAGDLLCHFAQKKQAVMLGLEMSESMQPMLNDYMASGGSAADRSKLLAAPFWTFASKFGMASTAILATIEKARYLKVKGLPVLLFAFDGTNDENTFKITDAENTRFMRDFIMATTIARRAAQYKNHHILVLTGNLHAVKTASEMRMASFIEKFVPVFSAKFVPTKGGQSWSCYGKSHESLTCGVSDVGADDTASAAGYDAVIKLNAIHAAIPAINMAEASANGKSSIQIK